MLFAYLSFSFIHWSLSKDKVSEQICMFCMELCTCPSTGCLLGFSELSALKRLGLLFSIVKTTEKMKASPSNTFLTPMPQHG